jgi:hypothetical protein
MRETRLQNHPHNLILLIFLSGYIPFFLSTRQRMRIDVEELADASGDGDEDLRARLASAAAALRPFTHWRREERPHAVAVVVVQALFFAGSLERGGELWA